jgi:FkbH-like protein
LNPASVLACSGNTANVLLLRLEDWIREDSIDEEAAQVGDEPSVEARLTGRAKKFVDALASSVARGGTPHLVCLCPASPQAIADPARHAALTASEQALLQASAMPGVSVISSAKLLSAYPVDQYADATADRLAHVPYTDLFFAGLGTQVARSIHALTRAPYKAIAVDCDQTLWKGICGEDGPDLIEIDSARRALQEVLVDQHNRGMLICLCSRNNEADVADVFAKRSDMPLSLDHVVASRLNWRPKSENLRSLADQLELGLDTFILLDDDPAECAEVQTHTPEVLTIQLPASTREFPRFLEHLWAFDGWPVTSEGQRRTAMYRDNAARGALRSTVATVEDYLDLLNVRVHFAEATPAQLPRVSELTYRTNQFNTTAIRRSEADVRRLLETGYHCLTAGVRDRFGDYGLVGLAIYRAEADALGVDSLLLSCRVLGRGVEHRILAKLGEMARDQGLNSVDLAFTSTARNEPARQFLDQLDATIERTPGGSVYRIAARAAAAAQFRPPATVTAGGDRARSNSPAITEPASDAQPVSGLFTWIAEEMRNPRQIFEAVRAERAAARLASGTAYVAPRTSIESGIAEIFEELLAVDRVGIHDGFFDLGGHSLLATQALSRIHARSGVEMPLSTMFSDEFTVEALARTVGDMSRQRTDLGPLDVDISDGELADLRITRKTNTRGDSCGCCSSSPLTLPSSAAPARRTADCSKDWPRRVMTAAY